MGCLQTKNRLCITYDILNDNFYVCNCEIDFGNYHMIKNNDLKKKYRHFGGYYGFYDLPKNIIIKEGIYLKESLKKILLNLGFKKEKINKLFFDLEIKKDMKDYFIN